jgi:hypothetical protein
LLAAIIIGALLLAGFLLFCVPADLKFIWDSRQKPSSEIRLEWFWGVFKLDVGTIWGRPAKKEAMGARGYTIFGKIDYARDLLSSLPTRKLLVRTLRLINDVVKQIKVKYLGARFRIGLGDPADTGFLLAGLGGIVTFLGLFTNELVVQPVFEADTLVFEGQIRATLRIRPIKLVVPLTRYIFSSVVLRSVWLMVLLRWKRRKYPLKYQLQSAG